MVSSTAGPARLAIREFAWKRPWHRPTRASRTPITSLIALIALIALASLTSTVDLEVSGH